MRDASRHLTMVAALGLVMLGALTWLLDTASPGMALVAVLGVLSMGAIQARIAARRQRSSSFQGVHHA